PAAKPLPPRRQNYIDDFIFNKIEAAKIPHAGLAPDAEFFRRANLDLWGRIPDAEDVRKFLADPDPGKREKLVDRLLGLDYKEKPGHDDYKGPWLVPDPFLAKWTYWFSDLFQNGPQGLEGRNAFRQYIHFFLKYNLPYDRIVREMLTATALSAEFSGPANFLIRNQVDGFRDADVMHEDTCDEIAVASFKAFLGINLECVSCHDGAGHLEKINLWLSQRKREEFWRQASFFGSIRVFRPALANQEFALVEGPPLRPETHWTGGGDGYRTDAPSVLRIARKKADVSPAFLLTGERPAAGANPREEFARMLTGHPQFAKATVNLTWSALMTVGIVDPPFGWDLARQDPKNPPPEPWTIQPSHPELLEALAADFRKHNYDLRRLMRVIATSTAYQLSSRAEGPWKPEYDRFYARKLVRRLSAEEIYDAIAKATGVFTPIQVAGTGKKVNYVMETFGPNDVSEPGMRRFLDFFGQSNRKTALPEARPGSIIQAALMLNSDLVKGRVKASAKDSTVQKLLSKEPPLGHEQLAEELFLATLSRFPTAGEKKTSVAFLARYRDQGAEDLQWSLINKLEFLFNY
ncbi:MAG: DUF1553 domain-containing protein, partial [Acidobacteria bacterium]|nr:DUF1553 domain-containing protein [Acidobacteriota bacterium]